GVGPGVALHLDEVIHRHRAEAQDIEFFCGGHDSEEVAAGYFKLLHTSRRFVRLACEVEGRARCPEAGTTGTKSVKGHAERPTSPDAGEPHPRSPSPSDGE